MKCMHIDILGISVKKWIGSGHFRSPKNTLMYWGHKTQRKNGVGMIITNREYKSLIGYKAVIDTIMHMRMKGTPSKYNLHEGVQAYN
jgi:hypothetical protein